MSRVRNGGYCPDLGRNAGFQPAPEPPRWRRYGQIRTARNGVGSQDSVASQIRGEPSGGRDLDMAAAPARYLRDRRYVPSQDAPEREKHPGITNLAYFASWREKALPAFSLSTSHLPSEGGSLTGFAAALHGGPYAPAYHGDDCEACVALLLEALPVVQPFCIPSNTHQKIRGCRCFPRSP
ncbi:hypothetical protein SBA2_270033 [Acidobacteriia bacterium SbA2]|nr:hypothetical protein SBA2_270033 [Acidobacteriia bacterium SbA2]